LKDLDKRLRIALSHIGSITRNLEFFQLNLDKIHKLVSVIEMPINIHIEIVCKGVRRLISEVGVGDIPLISIFINSTESRWSNTSVHKLISLLYQIVTILNI
jgi:hypothetical protein